MIETLLSVVVGAIIGFFGSTAYYSWVQRSEIRKEGFEEHIREELELIREEVAFNLKEELFQIGITEVTN